MSPRSLAWYQDRGMKNCLVIACRHPFAICEKTCQMRCRVDRAGFRAQEDWPCKSLMVQKQSFRESKCKGQEWHTNSPAVRVAVHYRRKSCMQLTFDDAITCRRGGLGAELPLPGGAALAAAAKRPALVRGAVGARRGRDQAAPARGAGRRRSGSYAQLPGNCPPALPGERIVSISCTLKSPLLRNAGAYLIFPFPALLSP